uniref:Uncharacterized protein n=1 Tax=Arundo donax TaxID=35708 RepID=A0A0A9FTG2_ARUDO
MGILYQMMTRTASRTSPLRKGHSVCLWTT